MLLIIKQKFIKLDLLAAAAKQNSFTELISKISFFGTCEKVETFFTLLKNVFNEADLSL